jgi:hypothetical protein
MYRDIISQYIKDMSTYVEMGKTDVDPDTSVVVVSVDGDKYALIVTDYFDRDETPISEAGLRFRGWVSYSDGKKERYTIRRDGDVYVLARIE